VLRSGACENDLAGGKSAATLRHFVAGLSFGKRNCFFRSKHPTNDLLISPLTFARQRITILAPHPDDESLATGGLIQRAVAEGAEVRVIFASDGENNPWPQRYLERRWNIGQPDRERWGNRRREEALAALRCLGLPPEHVHFAGWPDQGTTASLLNAQQGVVTALVEALAVSRPTLLVAPSVHDVHPDHNALAVLVNLALARLPAGPDVRVLHYLVHTRKQRLPVPHWTLHLSAGERAGKRQAILQHGSQIALSGKRFLAYARSVEHFYPPDAVDPSHPIRAARIERGTLCVRIQPARVPAGEGELFVALESGLHGSIRWRLPVHTRTGIVRICDAVSGRLLRRATIRCDDRTLEVRVPLSAVVPVQKIAVKFNRRLTFYDEAGWREVAMPVPDPAAGCGRQDAAILATTLESHVNVLPSQEP
jgi:LmbE family N-acetylglucosaminyl deacetylase